jgi:predicted NUDIX family phosphoesterase
MFEMAEQEYVLVVERKVLEDVGMFQGLQFDVNRYIQKFFVTGVPRFMPRAEVEKDPSFKQLIPYVIMSYNGKYLTYIRGVRAGESRLVAKRSIGIGGHINPVDWTLFSVDAYKTYCEAVQREIAEEVNVETSHTDTIVALLNDESNEVGSVHLGIVHFWTLAEPKVSRKEQMITQMTFMTPAELQQVRDTMETWSSLCLSGLEKMAERRRFTDKVTDR